MFHRNQCCTHRRCRSGRFGAVLISKLQLPPELPQMTTGNIHFLVEDSRSATFQILDFSQASPDRGGQPLQQAEIASCCWLTER